MAIERKKQKIFAGGFDSANGNIAKYGSKKAGALAYSFDLDEIQTSAWLQGMIGGTPTDKAPYLQDLNAIFYTFSKQLAYIFQAGIAEWNSQTEYIANRSVVLRNGKTYIAIANSTNVEPEVTSGWESSWESLSIKWGKIQGDLKAQLDLWNCLLKGLFFDSTISNGYSKGDRILTYFKGYKIYIDSTKDNNTDEPNDTNIYFLQNVKEAEWVITNDNPLPAASASQVGKIYFIPPNMPTTSFSTCYVGVDGGGGSYTWAQRYISTAADGAEIVFLKQTKTYYKKYSSDVYSPLGGFYSWICNTPYNFDLLQV